MIVALALFLPLFLVSLFLFLKRRPQLGPSEQGILARFDRAVFLVALVASAAAVVGAPERSSVAVWDSAALRL